MKRKIVQHGPATLTVSLPAPWVRGYNLRKGDEINVEQLREGIFLTAGKERHHGQKRISVKGMPRIISKAIAALYKAGYDEIIVEYSEPEELEKIHAVVSTSYIGFEIVDEDANQVTIRKVSEPAQEEFKTLFRRIFHFIISTSEEGIEAARKHDKAAHAKLILRDKSVNKLTNFCRRVVNKRGQAAYEQDAALYHVIEQLEKIADDYKALNELLADHGRLSDETLALYLRVHELLKSYENLFFEFSLEKVNSFLLAYDDFSTDMRSAKIPSDEESQRSVLQSIARKLYNLSGATMILHL